jgi:serine/threonine-protein kinase HipA
LYEGKPVGNIDDKGDGKFLHEITDAKLAHIIDNLPKDPLLTGMENPPRLSLAGAQSKFAVCKIDGKYYRSDDNYPTTHIIKITNKRFPYLLENELFCMKLALSLRFGVPNVALKSVEGRQFLEIERYDRQINDGKIERIHQEDFCQALGLTSDKKYQKGGGAKLKECYSIIDTFSDTKLADVSRFIEWIAFNYLIGNTDSHAKNISLLHTDSGIQLAPFYDLLSTEVYPEKIVDHEMAMLINGKGTYNSLRQKDFIALFTNLGLNATNILKSIKSKFANIIELAAYTKEQLPIADTKMYDDIITIIKKRYAVLFG